MLMTSSLSQSVPRRQAISRRVISMLLPAWCTRISAPSPGASALAAWQAAHSHMPVNAYFVFPLRHATPPGSQHALQGLPAGQQKPWPLT